MQVSQLNTSLDNIESVYSGKPGCMCGCNGKYTSPTESERSVKIMLKKVLSHPDVKIDVDAKCAVVDKMPCSYTAFAGRTIAVYFKDMTPVLTDAEAQKALRLQHDTMPRFAGEKWKE